MKKYPLISLSTCMSLFLSLSLSALVLKIAFAEEKDPSIPTASQIILDNDDLKYRKLESYIFKAKKFYWQTAGYFQDRQMKTLVHISAEISAIREQVQVLSDSLLNSAILDLHNASLLKSTEEKLDTIRSAKQSLTQAITIEKNSERKMYSVYLLGQVFLLLNEKEAAAHNFESVVGMSFEKELLGAIKYSPVIKQLKMESSAYLCAHYTRLKTEENINKWCSTYLIYQSANEDNIEQTEECISSSEQESCYQIANSLLNHYKTDDNQADYQALKKPKITILNYITSPFSKKSTQDVNMINHIYKGDSCKTTGDPTLLGMESCFWQFKIGIHNKDYNQAKEKAKSICKHYLNDSSIFDEKEYIGISACNSLGIDSLWKIVSDKDRQNLVFEACQKLNPNLCNLILNQGNAFDRSRLKVYHYLNQQCWLSDSTEHCKLLDTLKPNQDYARLKLKQLTIGLKSESDLWDLSVTGRRGSDKPDVEITVSTDSIMILRCKLDVKETRTNKDDVPTLYILNPNQCVSKAFSKKLADKKPFLVKVIDVDPTLNDLIGETAMRLDQANHSHLEFAAVKHLEFETINY